MLPKVLLLVSVFSSLTMGSILSIPAKMVSMMIEVPFLIPIGTTYTTPVHWSSPEYPDSSSHTDRSHILGGIRDGKPISGKRKLDENLFIGRHRFESTNMNTTNTSLKILQNIFYLKQFPYRTACQISMTKKTGQMSFWISW